MEYTVDDIKVQNSFSSLAYQSTVKLAHRGCRPSPALGKLEIQAVSEADSIDNPQLNYV